MLPVGPRVFPLPLGQPALLAFNRHHKGETRAFGRSGSSTSRHPMHGRIARAASEYLGQSNRAHSDRARRARGLQVGTRTRVTRSKLYPSRIGPRSELLRADAVRGACSGHVRWRVVVDVFPDDGAITDAVDGHLLSGRRLAGRDVDFVEGEP